MEKEKIEEKKCELCKDKATNVCFDCSFYLCDSCFKFLHEKKANLDHKKDDINHFFSFNIKCPKHQKVTMNLFCIEEKSNNLYS